MAVMATKIEIKIVQIENGYIITKTGGVKGNSVWCSENLKSITTIIDNLVRGVS